MALTTSILVMFCVVVVAYAAVVPYNQTSRCEQNSVTPLSCANVSYSDDSLVPHPDDCGLFYYCLDPSLPPVCRECPASLHFSPSLHVCDWPQQAGCNASAPATTTPAPLSSRCVERTVTQVSCANITSPDSLLEHPDDCFLFYYCEQPYLPAVCRECPSQLHFNPAKHVCDYEYRAGCNLDSTTVTAA